MDWFFIVMGFLAVFAGVGFYKQTRGITYFGRGSDNEKQAYAASQSHLWKWPSDMHQFGQEKTRMKDVTVILLSYMQRIMKDQKSDRPLVALCGFCNSLAAVFVYAVASLYWGQAVGFFSGFLYIVSFWPWQIALIGGHICVAQIFFLFSVLSIQVSEHAWNPVLAFCLAGIFFGLSQFASASARKFIPLFLAALFFSQRAFLQTSFPFSSQWLERAAHVMGNLWPMALVVACVLTGLRLCYPRVLKEGYEQHGPVFLNRLFPNRGAYSLDHYLRRGRGFIRAFEMGVGAGVLFVFLYLIFFGKASFVTAVLPCFFGGAFVALALLLPDILKNAKGYFDYFHIGQKYCHFVCYEGFFERIGKPIPKGMRGAGWVWIIKFLRRVIPWHVFLFICAGMLLVIDKSSNLMVSLGIILVSLSPAFWAEWTRAPQIGRAYFPVFFGLLLLIAYVASGFLERGILPGGYGIFAVFMGFGLFAAAWNLKVFLRDIYPARMCAARLVKFLNNLGIQRIYTYNNHFNKHFFLAIPEGDLEGFQVEYIETMKDIHSEEGVVVVPGTSAKAINMEGTEPGCLGRDFREDPFLNKLMDQGAIAHLALERFETYGNSRIWVNEGEPTTYREIILREITDHDRFLSHGWILSCRDVMSFVERSAEQPTL